jgi:hypothetical protein
MPVVSLNLRKEEIPAGTHVVVAVVRNEALRLPFLLSYYREKGFGAFLVVDNGSTDGTCEYLLSQEDTWVFSTTDDYSSSRFGLDWTNLLLDQFCVGHWSLVVDADEMLVWPGCENEAIADLTRRLDRGGAEALFTILLDMYSERPFGKIGYRAGAPFLESSRFFEGPYAFLNAQLFPYYQVYGGVRARAARMLPELRVDPPTVSKLPLVKWRRGQRFTLSTHALLQPMQLAPMRGALLHFKMFDDIVEKCRIEVERGQHFGGAREYRLLRAAIDRLPRRTFHDPKLSVRYVDTAGLLKTRILDAERPF